MAENWTFVSEEWKTISLHDHRITCVEESGPDLILRFDEDGFDVTCDNSLNPTGRHRNTGPAAAILKNWCWEDGAFGSYCFRIIRLGNGQEKHIPLPIVPITRTQFLHDLTLEVLDFIWEPDKGLLTLDGNGYMSPPPPGSEDGFADIKLRCDRLLFCWNGLPQDAWFQERPRK
ncbi:hypothetical protein [Flintibacter muris]|uniref:hypothetical protein n=1 Tax=Flintibacter muris TaxID=2941327 RepID=UPI00203B759C|nr:hypothetical protein [Flintibacter muris]